MTMDRSFLEAALIGYQRQQDEIDAKISELRQAIGGSPKRPSVNPDGNGATAAAKKGTRKKRKLSAAAIKRISEATKKRWAAYRAAKAAGHKSSRKA